MIRLIENAAAVPGTIVSPNAAGTRVLSLLGAYGTGYDFARFWAQYDENAAVTALMSRLDGAATVWNIKNADYEEILHFFGAVGCSSLLIEGAPLPLKAAESGKVMRFSGEPITAGNICCDQPKLEDVYSIMSTYFNMPQFDGWYADMSHRIRHGFAKCYTNLGASAAATATTEKSALIYGLTTLPQKRGNGFGGELLDNIVADLINDGKKDIFVMVENQSLNKFYVNHKFVDFSQFNTYRLDEQA